MTLEKIAQKRFRQLNEQLFDGSLPRLNIAVRKHASKNNLDADFVSYFLPEDGKPEIILYKVVDDKVLIHEMVHYLLYITYLPSYELSGKTPTDCKLFQKKYAHTKEFWDTLRKVMSFYK